MLLAGGCMLMPALTALVQHRLIDRAPWHELGLDPRRIRLASLLLTVLVGAAIIPLTLVVCHVLGDRAGVLAFGHVDWSSAHLIERFNGMLTEAGRDPLPESAASLLRHVPGPLIMAVGIGSAIVAAFTLNLPFMLGEELGWRGYMYHALAHWPMPRRVLFTGTVWGLWHAPLILMGHNYPEHPWLGIPLMVVFCVLLALLFDLSRTRVGAVWGPCVLHRGFVRPLCLGWPNVGGIAGGPCRLPRDRTAGGTGRTSPEDRSGVACLTDPPSRCSAPHGSRSSDPGGRGHPSAYSTRTHRRAPHAS
jgi:membrane protease YdiL (CAAX protease family)